MRLPRSLEVPLSCLALASCGDPEARAAQAIVGRGIDGSYVAVLALEHTDTGGQCTAVLLSRRVVLTAKHGVQGPGDAGPVAPTRLRVGVVGASGAVADPSTRWLSVRSVRAVPGVFAPPPFDASDLAGRDLAALVLEEDPAVVPLATATPAGGRSPRRAESGQAQGRWTGHVGLGRSVARLPREYRKRSQRGVRTRDPGVLLPDLPERPPRCKRSEELPLGCSRRTGTSPRVPRHEPARP